MKKLIVEEVSSFRAEVRAQARAAGQIRRQDTLPIPSREEIISSPIQEDAPANGATSGFTARAQQGTERLPSPIMDDPGDQLEKELAMRA